MHPSLGPPFLSRRPFYFVLIIQLNRRCFGVEWRHLTPNGSPREPMFAHQEAVSRGQSEKAICRRVLQQRWISCPQYSFLSPFSGHALISHDFEPCLPFQFSQQDFCNRSTHNLRPELLRGKFPRQNLGFRRLGELSHESTLPQESRIQFEYKIQNTV